MALEILKNIKIPYPSEGVIRTAALDDTVSPIDSVQIAVNMNFDRIGAFQTRLGITEYADDLVGDIKNFGTLNNSKIDYERIVNANGSTFDNTLAEYISAIKIDNSHILVFWAGSGSDGFAQVMEIDSVTGLLSPIGTPLEFDTTLGEYNKVIQIDVNHYLNVWSGSGNDGFAQVFTVDPATWAVTAESTPLEFDTTFLVFPTLAKVDANHFICFYGGTAGSVGSATILEVSLSTWAVTVVGVPLTFDASGVAQYNSCAPLLSDNRFINFWSGSGADGFVQVFTVNTTTWGITAESTPLEFDTTNGTYNSCVGFGDGQHFINFWQGADGDGFAQVFEVNLTTFAVTASGAALEFDTSAGFANSAISLNNGEDFVNFWESTGAVGRAQIFRVNLSTYAITGLATPNDFAIGAGIMFNSSVLVSPTKVANFWKSSSDDGVMGMFNLEGDVLDSSYLYAQEEDGDVFNWNGTSWSLRRTNLETVGKARFAQYLDYIWMVNGNASIGDPVATSNGGPFGQDLVPEGFPEGDFIQAGFEGRVWVADKLYDVVYFTDIVQFTPPDTYTLSYDPDINFIKNFSPQNGQTITAMATTPRALLLFKQDSIYRIYGSTSADAYPAYNVGTYSQESIIQTKDGIYFHHSSGFYKFSYDSQPIEISRRIIDFIQAIPRSNYENIVGIYDGFDSVEWAIGAVTVEGVTFTNCVCRYTISTQVWTIYDYPGNYITAMIQYDDLTDLNMIMGTDEGKVCKMDDGLDDLGAGIYFEIIDRWRTYSDVYAKAQAIDGINVYNENAGGTKIQYQTQKASTNVWEDLGTIDENASALLPNASTEDFNAARLRINGVTKGTPAVFHGIELLEVQIKGYDKN